MKQLTTTQQNARELNEAKSTRDASNFWSLMIPAFLNLLMIYAILVADGFFLSLISDEVAGIFGGVISQIFSLIFGLLTVMSQAACAVASQFIGAKDHSRVRFAYKGSLVINVCFAAILAFCLLAMSVNMSEIFGLPTEYGRASTFYVAILTVSVVVFSIRISYTYMLASMNKLWVDSYVNLIQLITNIALNYLFISSSLFGEELHMLGVAVATVISMFVSAVLLFLYVHGVLGLKLKYGQSGTKFLKPIISKILSIGIPSSIELASTLLAQFIVTLFVLKVGVLAIAAKTYVGNIFIFLFAWTLAIGIANQIVVAKYVGMKELNAVKRTTKRSLLFAASGQLFFVLILYIFLRPVIQVFSIDDSIHYIALQILLLSFILEPLRAVNLVLVYSMVGSGDAKYPVFGGAAIVWLFGIPLCYLFGVIFTWGVIGIWVALCLDELLRSLFYIHRWKSRKWAGKSVIKHDVKICPNQDGGQSNMALTASL